MTETTVQATPKGELPHLKSGKRKSVQLRLTPSEHKELMRTAKNENRSMSFVAHRRYRSGLNQE
ncbi:hypothetical protein [Psychrobacter pacificensis]|uniref:Uncharacterized protein n=1 Tax=Psychrobacter pacificensis TaxID=112002 RepID=A0A1G7B3X9_9GAMM|nr:hypothetical protein [Psychrobacter pacificensis]GLR27793.1 hypothetical protein GCM10007915_00310 [Psychrobacter pacificensis]GLR28969.1 hypothetical protein GCM10007915_12070 [Psychrobacter pacificensis]SDE21557.1 hypothetical protein SAMN05660405_02702 [Psychrobacter pacificensis]|tara:strand:- start:410 stop:601 length:192 start_codon:yes stop_codon:yes gene_type:complete